MIEDLEGYLKAGYQRMRSSVDHLKSELQKVRAGKASPGLVSNLMVEYYGSPTPMSQVANISATDSKTLSIQPWEKTMLAPIEKAIFEANLGITPMNNGEVVLLVIPPMTEDRRRSLAKQCKALGEDAKIALRNERQKLMDAIKKEVKDGYPEDAGKRKEEEVQSNVKSNSTSMDNLVSAKEKEIMTV